MSRRSLVLLLVLAGLVLVGSRAHAQPGTTARVSVASGGGQGDDNTHPSPPAFSSTGRYVAFASGATNLVPNDTNDSTDVFVHDRQTGETTLVSSFPWGQPFTGSAWPALSADGRLVAFVSSAPGRCPPCDTYWGVFVHDRQTGSTTRIAGGEHVYADPSAPSYAVFYGHVTMSPDGRHVAFTSDAYNLVPGPTRSPGVYVYDANTGLITHEGDAGIVGDTKVSLSGDGRFVAFSSPSPGVVPGDNNLKWDVFVRDRQSKTTTRVSMGLGGAEANANSLGPSLSSDGRYAAFSSSATNLVPGDTNASQDVFVHDRQTGLTTRASVATGGGESNWHSFPPSLSADGRYVAFYSWATNLVDGDTNGLWDVFVRDRQTQTTTRIVAGVSYGAPGVSESDLGFVSLSDDGRHVGFCSDASDLVAGDTNGKWDVFVHDRGAPRSLRDYDGDAKSDPTVFRPSNGTWYQLRSGAGTGTGVSWGVDGDTPVSADYDGDGKADVAVFRPSEGRWYVLQSSSGGGTAISWGISTDMPVHADYDGDGKADIAVFRPSAGAWFIVPSRTNVPTAITWGTIGDVPVPADYDGDGKADPTVFRPSTGTWYQLRSTTGAGFGLAWGQAGDVPLAGDYDGDGKADPTVFRASVGTWFELRSSAGAGFGVVWGASGDQPLVGDYDGDGKADPTIFRPSSGTWYQLRSGTGSGHGVMWGAAADLPQ